MLEQQPLSQCDSMCNYIPFFCRGVGGGGGEEEGSNRATLVLPCTTNASAY